MKRFLVLTKKNVPKFKIILAEESWTVSLHLTTYSFLRHYSLYASAEADIHKCPVV